MGVASLGLVEVMQLLVHAASLGVAWVPDGPAAVQLQKVLRARLLLKGEKGAAHGGRAAQALALNPLAHL